MVQQREAEAVVLAVVVVVVVVGVEVVEPRSLGKEGPTQDGRGSWQAIVGQT